jgi:hypothetical protein
MCATKVSGDQIVPARASGKSYGPQFSHNDHRLLFYDFVEFGLVYRSASRSPSITWCLEEHCTMFNFLRCMLTA